MASADAVARASTRGSNASRFASSSASSSSSSRRAARARVRAARRGFVARVARRVVARRASRRAARRRHRASRHAETVASVNDAPRARARRRAARRRAARAPRIRASSHASRASFGDADVLRWARRAWRERVRDDGDVVVDATLGCGRDALYLALECASPDVFIRGFDVASEALEASTRAFEDARVAPRRFAFERRCHAEALEAHEATGARDVGVLMANLGYMPGAQG